MPNMLAGVISPSQIDRRSAALHPLARKPQAAHEAPGGLIPQDRVELSEATGARDKGHEGRRIRCRLVERLRQSIAADDYLTPEKIDGTVERLHRGLFGP